MARVTVRGNQSHKPSELTVRVCVERAVEKYSTLVDDVLDRRQFTAASQEEVTCRRDDVSRHISPLTRLVSATDIKRFVGRVIRENDEEVIVTDGRSSSLSPASKEIDSQGGAGSSRRRQEDEKDARPSEDPQSLEAQHNLAKPGARMLSLAAARSTAR